MCSVVRIGAWDTGDIEIVADFEIATLIIKEKHQESCPLHWDNRKSALKLRPHPSTELSITVQIYLKASEKIEYIQVLSWKMAANGSAQTDT